MKSQLPELAWHKKPEDILSIFQTDFESGLSASQVIELTNTFGKNEIKEKKKQSNFTLFLRQFKNPMVYTLTVAALIALALGEFLDFGAIMIIVILNAVTGFVQEAKANDAIAALKKLSVPKVRVLREGKVSSVDSSAIVPGDIIYLEAGDYVSADARILKSFQLSCDEAPLTGESVPVKKTADVLTGEVPLGDRKNMVHFGTSINTGSAHAVVTATGMSTEMGKIASLLEETKIEETPLQKKLEGVTKKLIVLGVIVIILVIIIRYYNGDEWIPIFMSAISLAVAAIPEGLPTVVTIALTLAVRRMTRRNAIVRNIAAVETLGSTDIICTDKTGTLTAGIMSVREMIVYESQKESDLMRGMILCNNATLDTGDSTEVALLKFAEDKGLFVNEVREKNHRIHEWAFESDRKRMSVLAKTDEGEKLYVKGAPESMIPRCHLSEEGKKKIQDKVHEHSSKGQRVLAFAMKSGSFAGDSDDVEKDLSYLGLVALADPPKPEAIQAITECKDAGIKVVMITGDHPSTARAIGNELGITGDVLTGSDLDKMSVDELRDKAESTAVYARVSPLHKLKIIAALQANKHVVAMTGDGVNDAPALKKAEIGVSMGKNGTEVARQASNMILTDDNFATIVSAVEEGRAIYGNIKRTIQYLLSTNLAEILIVLGASIAGLPVPFTPIGLLWINIVTDGFPSLALAAEPLDKNILKNSSRPSPKTFFDPLFVKELFFTGILITILCLGFYHYSIDHYGLEKSRSMAFNLLVFMCLSRSFSCRSETKTFFELRPNIYHLFSVMIPIVLQYSLQFQAWFQKLFAVIPLTMYEFAYLLLLSIIPPTVVEIRKIFIRKSIRQ